MPVSRTPQRPAAVIAASVCLLLSVAACASTTSSSSPSLSGTPKGIVLDLAGQVEVLADLAGGAPHATAGTATPGSASDPLALRQVAQLSATLVVGIEGSQGQLATVNPQAPGTPNLLASGHALSWFPAANGRDLWAVRMSTDQSCPLVEHGQIHLPRYQLGELDTTGTMIEPFRLLGCGVLPISESSKGLVIKELTTATDTGTPSGRVLTNLDLLGTQDALKPLITDTNPLAAAGDTVVIAPRQCTSGSCVATYNLATGRQSALPVGSGDKVATGAGTLDPTGRYYATAVLDNATHTTQLAVVDIQAGTATSIGAYSTYTAPSPGSLADDMPSVWSGDRFLALDPSTSTLLSYDASSGKTATHSGLDLKSSSGVWGASS